MTEESQATSSTQEITQLAPNTPPRPPDSSSAEVLVGRQLRHLRHTRGLSLRTLADQSGLNINTLSLIENGKSSPSVSTLQLLSQALDVPIAFFFESEPIKKKVVYQPKDQRSRSLLQDKSLENLGKDLAGSAVQPFIVHLKWRFPCATSSTRRSARELNAPNAWMLVSIAPLIFRWSRKQ